MVKGLECKTQEEQLSLLGLFNLQNRKQRSDLTMAHTSLMRGSGVEGEELISSGDHR